jgi:hypothetical protein
MASKKPKTKKITRTAWNKLDAGTRKRALQHILGPHFHDYMVADSLHDDFIFWEIILRNVRVVVDDTCGYKLSISSKCYIN